MAQAPTLVQQTPPPTPAASSTPAREPLVATAQSLELQEMVNCVWRLVAAAGTTTEDLESPRYCDVIAGKLTDFDLIDVVSEDRVNYWKCLVIQGGRDGATGATGGRGRLLALPGYPARIPAINRQANDGLPENYSVVYDGFRNVHIPYWGSKALAPDGFVLREDARALCVHHSSKATRARA